MFLSEKNLSGNIFYLILSRKHNIKNIKNKEVYKYKIFATYPYQLSE